MSDAANATRTKVDLPKLVVTSDESGLFNQFRERDTCRPIAITGDEGRANALEIAHRCNVHDELVKALRYIADARDASPYQIQMALDVLANAEGRAEASEAETHGDPCKHPHCDCEYRCQRLGDALLDGLK